MASIAQRPNGKWRARYRDSTGREHARHFDDRCDAEAWLAEVGAVADGRGGARRRFGEQAVWWQSVQVHRESTAAQVDSYFRNHVLPYLGDRPLGEVRPSEIQAWVKDRSAVLAPATVELVHRYVAAIFASAVDDGLIAASPCTRGIRLPRRERRPVQPLTVDQVLTVAHAVPTRWRALVITAAGTGLRQGELFGLPMSSIDLARRTVTVDQQLVLLRGAPKIGPPKTAASYRTVPLPDVIVDGLTDHVARWPADGELGLVFTTETGQPIRRNRFRESWTRAVAAADLPEGAKFHELRHFYASLLIAAGESVKVVQARLGHASATETLDTYGHLWPDAEDRTRDAIDTAFAAATRRSANPQDCADSRTAKVAKPLVGGHMR